MDDDVTSALDARRNLGAALRRFRKERGLNTQELADRLGYSRSTVSRSENGEKSITPEQLQEMIEHLSIDPVSARALHVLRDKTDEEQWWDDEYYGFLTPNMRRNAGYEAAARSFKIMETHMIPGLFQSDKYIELLLATVFDPSSKMYQKRVKYRLDRRRYLLPERGVKFHAVVDEAALVHCFSWEGVGDDQLTHMIKLADQENIILQIVPMSVPKTRVIGSRTLMEFGPDINPVVFSEISLGSRFSELGSDIAETESLFQSFLKLALSPEDSRNLLEMKLSR